MSLGARIRRRREEKGIRAAELARQAKISKGYLSQLENAGDENGKPSADILFRIAQALDTTIADLLGKEVRIPQRAAPKELRDFADEADLPQADVDMLARIQFRGRQPVSKDDWRFLYDAIRRAIPPKTPTS